MKKLSIEIVAIVLLVALISSNGNKVSSWRIYNDDDNDNDMTPLLCPHMHMALVGDNLNGGNDCILIARVPFSYARTESFCLAYSDYLMTIETESVWNALVVKLNQLRCLINKLRFCFCCCLILI